MHLADRFRGSNLENLFAHLDTIVNTAEMINTLYGPDFLSYLKQTFKSLDSRISYTLDTTDIRKIGAAVQLLDDLPRDLWQFMDALQVSPDVLQVVCVDFRAILKNKPPPSLVSHPNPPDLQRSAKPGTTQPASGQSLHPFLWEYAPGPALQELPNANAVETSNVRALLIPMRTPNTNHLDLPGAFPEDTPALRNHTAAIGSQDDTSKIPSLPATPRGPTDRPHEDHPDTWSDPHETIKTELIEKKFLHSSRVSSDGRNHYAGKHHHLLEPARNKTRRRHKEGHRKSAAFLPRLKVLKPSGSMRHYFTSNGRWSRSHSLARPPTGKLDTPITRIKSHSILDGPTFRQPLSESPSPSEVATAADVSPTRLLSRPLTPTESHALSSDDDSANEPVDVRHRETTASKSLEDERDRNDDTRESPSLSGPYDHGAESHGVVQFRDEYRRTGIEKLDEKVKGRAQKAVISKHLSRQPMRPFEDESLEDESSVSAQFGRLMISVDKQKEIDDVGADFQLRQDEELHLQREKALAAEAEEKRRAEERELAKTGGLRVPRGTLVADLSNEWEQKINGTLVPSNALPKTKGGTLLKNSDFYTVVNATQWLNDEIINGALEWLDEYVNKAAGVKEDRSPMRKCLFTGSFFWKKIENNGPNSTQRIIRRLGITSPDQFLNVETVLIPICNHNHWTLMVVRPKKRTIAHMDSLNPAGSPKYIDLARKWVRFTCGEKYVDDEWTVTRHEAPLQTNGYDCGMHTITNAMCVALGLNPMKTYDADDMPLQRLRIAGALVNSGFSGDFDLSKL